MANTESFFPLETDSVETLEDKYNSNMDAAWGEIVTDMVIPDRDSDVTDHQSNAIISRELIEEKTNANKCEIYNPEIEEHKPCSWPDYIIPEETEPCVQPNGIIPEENELQLPPNEEGFAEVFAKCMAIGGVVYYGLKILEIPLLTNPVTFPIYFTH